MKTKTIISLLCVQFILMSFNYFTNYKVKDNYTVKIKGGRIEGEFRGLKSSLIFDPNNLESSKITALIDANSLKTGNSLMDKHAKSESGLNTKIFSSIIFESTSIEKSTTGYIANGKLILKGVTKAIQIPFTFTTKSNEEYFQGKLTIIPSEYNVTRMGTPSSIDIDLFIPVNS